MEFPSTTRAACSKKSEEQLDIILHDHLWRSHTLVKTYTNLGHLSSHVENSFELPFLHVVLSPQPGERCLRRTNLETSKPLDLPKYGHKDC